LPFLVLVAQNLIIFQNHYFRDHGFPWDFIGGYYAMVAFWTTLVSQGVIPSWIPFDSMGLPLGMLLQSGFHYPPFWLFPLLRIQYTLHAAVVFQCLHVLAGAIGMYLFLRRALDNQADARIYPFFGAFVFQLFGGFYSNAEHADIVRAFALTPWCFYVLTLSRSVWQRIPGRHLAMPGILLLVATGAYPGNLISTAVVMSLYFLLQIIELTWQGWSLRTLRSSITPLVLLALAGVGMSLLHLAPPLLLNDYFYRSGQIGQLSLGFLGVSHLSGLFLDNELLIGDVSMTSTYITLPALVVLTYLPLRALKQHWPMAGVLLFSLLMVSGPSSLVWFVLTRLLRPLQFSRFPASDYRIFVAIALIYFSVLALASLLDRSISWRSFLFRTLLAFLWCSQGLYLTYPDLRSRPVYAALAVIVATTMVLAMYRFFPGWLQRRRRAAAAALIILVALDAARVLPTLDLPLGNGGHVSTWGLGYPGFSDVYRLNGWPLETDDTLLTYSILPNTPITRPARVERRSRADYAWEGYITGRYVLFYAPILQSARTIIDQPVYKRFMQAPWTPLFFELDELDPRAEDLGVNPRELETKLLAGSGPSPAPVRQTNYGITEITYEVSLGTPLLMVENETYFPGWTATLYTDGVATQLEAVPFNRVFRAWFLPAGEYKMVARFEFPREKTYAAVSVASFLLWMLLVLKYSVRARARGRNSPAQGAPLNVRAGTEKESW
jgi:hypothetical protein